MPVYTPASEVLLRHSEELATHRILFAGDIQDSLPAQFAASACRVWTSQFHHWNKLQATMGERARFGLVATPEDVGDSDALIYYWPKSKNEARFQLTNLLALMPVGSAIFIIGENRSGVRSAEQILTGIATLNKADSARRCGLYYAPLDVCPEFSLDKWWSEYHSNGLTIKTLPGVFSHDGLDVGSQLLLSTLTPHTKGKVLDVGCGAGVLSVALAQHSPKVRLTLCDTSAAAVAASRVTLAANGIEGEVIASDVYSQIPGRFDLILSNPPFHDGLQTSFDAPQALIRGALTHLNTGGELRLVANAFLPYPKLLDEIFGNHEVLAQTGRYKVYRAIYSRRGRANA